MNQTYDAQTCIMTNVMALISGRWKPIILHLIRNDINRFSLLEKSMPRISRKILSEQLRELEKDHLLHRVVKGTKAPFEVTYFLTDKGTDVRRLLDYMLDWGLEFFKEEISIALVNDHQAKASLTEFLKPKQQGAI